MLLGIMFTLYTTIKTRGKPDTTKQLASHIVQFYVKQRREGPVPSKDPVSKGTPDEAQPTKRRFECLTCLERDHELASCSQCRAAEMRCRICRSCRICRVCAEKRFDCCSFCRSVFYCDEECQRRDLPVHQKECRRLESDRAYRKARERADQGVPLRMLCRVCPGDGALCCKGCRSSFYCSQSCQRADWSAHKKECAGLALKRDEEDEGK